MNTALRILHIEDNPVDSDLIRLRLKSEGFECSIEIADTEELVKSALATGTYDLILCDYSLPGYNGLSALKHVRESYPDLPFIFISGTLGEARAIEAIKSGATDYVLKDELTRLGTAIRRALLEAEERRKRKAAELALKDSEASFRLLFATNPHPMWVDDLETFEFLEVNDAAIELYGYSREEFLRMKITDLHETDNIPRLQAAVRDNASRGGMSTGWRHKLKNGTLIDVEVTSHVLEFGGRNAAIVIAQNVTERKQAAESLQLFRTLLDRSQDIIEVLDPNTGKFLDVNEAACRIQGYTREELLSMTVMDIDPNFPDAVSFQQSMANFEQNSTTSIESVHKRKDGSMFPVEVRVAQVRLDRHYAVATVRDISDRKHNEENLRRSEDRYRTLFEESQDALFISAEDHFLDINPAGLKLYGFDSKEEAVSINLSTDLFVDPDARNEYLNVLHTQGSVKDYELLLRKKNGDQITVLETSTVIRDDSGAITGYRGNNRDITEKKAFEAQLLRTQRLESIGTLASGVAHDLNNVLGPIMMSVDLLKKMIPDPSVNALLATVGASAARGADIVRQVLTFARGAGGERIPVQVKHIVSELESIIRQTFPKSIALSLDMPRELSLVQADPTQLQQVLLNLCVNARDAMPTGGTLTVSASMETLTEMQTAAHAHVCPGQFVSIRVTDSGEGIPPEHLGKIFDPFFTTKELGKGTGLGLSTAMGIITSHGGFFQVTSTVGKGTTFAVNLPAFAAQAVEGVAPPVHTTAGKGELILVIDDEQSITNIASLILESSGYKVVSANDGTEALSIFGRQHGNIRAVVTDLMMPGLDGGAIIQRLRKVDPAIRVIAMTGLPEEIALLRNSGLSLDGSLEKPFTAHNLLETLSGVLRK